MKKFLFITGLILFIAFGNFSCEKPDSTQTFFTDSAIIAYNTCVDILKNNSSYNICLDSIWDSRCPEGAVCCCAGNTVCKFKLTYNGQSYPFKLAIPVFGPIKSDTTLIGIKIKMKEVTPYPNVNGRYTYNDYRAKIVLSN